MRGTLSSPLESLCTRCTRRARRSRCTAACLVPPQRLDRGSMHGRRSTARLPWPFAVAPEAVRIDVLDHSRRQRALHLGGKHCACTRRPLTFFVQRTRTDPVKALEIVGVHGFASPVLQWWRRTSSRVASREAGRPRRLEHSCRGCQDGLVTYGVGWLQRHLAAGRRHQHSCVSRSGDLPTTSASTHTRSHPQSRRISPAYLRHAFRTRGELPTAPI